MSVCLSWLMLELLEQSLPTQDTHIVCWEHGPMESSRNSSARALWELTGRSYTLRLWRACEQG